MSEKSCRHFDRFLDEEKLWPPVNRPMLIFLAVVGLAEIGRTATATVGLWAADVTHWSAVCSRRMHCQGSGITMLSYVALVVHIRNQVHIQCYKC